jgi:RimJ/RimL family protein N-acetyltransferase
MLAVVHSHETEDEILGMLGIEKVNLTRRAGHFFYTRYRDSTLFWDGVRLFFDEVFLALPLRRFYVEVPSYEVELREFLATIGASLDLQLKQHKFFDGALHTVEVWSVWRRDDV